MNDLPPLWNVNWQQYAACRGCDPDVFFPRRGKDLHEPKTICAGCPVLEDCRSWASFYGERLGIWGGLSWNERRRARRGLPEHDCPDCGINHVPRDAAQVLCHWCRSNRKPTRVQKAL